MTSLYWFVSLCHCVSLITVLTSYFGHKENVVGGAQELHTLKVWITNASLCQLYFKMYVVSKLENPTIKTSKREVRGNASVTPK